VVDAGLNAPNDLAVAADGTLYLTDPGNPFLQTRLPARVVALSPNGRMRTLAEDFAYCNGIATGDGELFVTDHGGVIRIGFDGAREWAVKFEGGVDGLALDVDGRLYVCGQADGIIRVFDGAAQVDELRVGSRACVTNCCFGGPELRDLYVTDALAGAVLVFTGMPSPGRPVLSRATSG
jgi:gluconolactonase